MERPQPQPSFSTDAKGLARSSCGFRLARGKNSSILCNDGLPTRGSRFRFLADVYRRERERGLRARKGSASEKGVRHLILLFSRSLLLPWQGAIGGEPSSGFGRQAADARAGPHV